MLTVSIKGKRGLEKGLRDMSRSLDRADIVMRVVSRRMLKMQRQHFKDQRQMDGSPWPALAPATIEARRKGDPTKGRSPQMLQDTRILFNSLDADSGRTFAAVGVPKSVPYGVYHQFGTRNIP